MNKMSAGMQRVAKLPHKDIVTCKGDTLSVPKFIRRLEYDGQRYWSVEPGKSGLFTPGAGTRRFSDFVCAGAAPRDPAISLKEAIRYLASIYLCPAAKALTVPARNSKRFMPPGLRLKMRRHPPRVQSPPVWVIQVDANYKQPFFEAREYVIVGEDGDISQERFVEAMREALMLRAMRLIQRGKAHGNSHGVDVSDANLMRLVRPVMAYAGAPAAHESC